MIFTKQGAWHGFRMAMPVALSVYIYGSVFGLLARQADMTFATAVAMSLLVFAGSSQFIVLELWQAPLPVLTIAITTLVVNLRHVLMGVALKPYFSDLTKLQSYGSAFFVTDENWAISMREFQQGYKDSAILIGSGFAVYLAWVGATVTGFLAGSLIANPEQWGIDFAFLAVFIALLATMWRGKSDLLPWVVAAAVSIAAALWLPGKWYILLGGLAGSIAGAMQHD